MSSSIDSVVGGRGGGAVNKEVSPNASAFDSLPSPSLLVQRFSKVRGANSVCGDGS